MSKVTTDTEMWKQCVIALTWISKGSGWFSFTVSILLATDTMLVLQHSTNTANLWPFIILDLFHFGRNCWLRQRSKHIQRCGCLIGPQGLGQHHYLKILNVLFTDMRCYTIMPWNKKRKHSSWQMFLSIHCQSNRRMECTLEGNN